MPRSRHGWRWAGALGTALALHYALLALLTSSPSPPPTAPFPRSNGLHLLIEVLPDGANSAHDAALLANTPVPSAEPADRSTPAARNKRDASRSVRFFTLEEVERPAVPSLDWQLPLDRVVATGLRRLVVRIWILEDGSVADIEILSTRPAALGPRETKEFEEWLRRTELHPAIRNDRPVASVRTLEMAFDL